MIPLLLFLISLAVFCAAAYRILNVQWLYHEAEKEYEDLRKYTEKDPNPKKDKCPVKVDFDKLRKVNPDVIGWIYIPKTDIDYPIVQGKDNSYYLHRTYKKENNFAGSIFLDSNCRKDFYSANSVVYGHNMRNGSMFGMLKKYYDTKYNEKADYKKRNIVWIVTPTREKEYTIFAAREINVSKDMDVYTIDFGTVEEYQEYLENAVKKSLYNTKVPVSTNNFILTLSTCTSTTETGRFIIQCKLIQDTERNAK